MQLRHLRVRNIRSYEKAELDFGPGTTLISGDVGAGKTSLLYAIEMALFGSAEVNAAYLVRHGAQHAEVSVAFGDGGRTYEISRRFRRLRRKGQETFEAERIRFTVDGNDTSYSATELRRQVIDLLGFPDNPSPQAHSDLWRWAVYVPQERMRDILGARPQDRLETVRRALGVERYRTAAENAQELATDLRRTAVSRRAEADRLRHFDEEFERGSLLSERLRTDRTSLDASTQELRDRVEKRKEARDRAERSVRKAEADDRELTGLERADEDDRRSLEEKERARTERDSEREGRRQELELLAPEAESLAARQKRLGETEQRLASLRAEFEEKAGLLRALAEARARLRGAEEAEEAARSALERSRSEERTAQSVLEEAQAEGPAKEPPAPTEESVSTLDEKVAEARGRESAALQSLTKAEGSLAELDELLSAGVCPRCQQPVRPEEFASHRTEAAAEVNAARTALAEMEQRRTRLESERKARERYERAFERWTQVEKRRSTARAATERARTAGRAAEAALEERRSQVEESRHRMEELAPEEGKASALRAKLDECEADRIERSREVESARIAEEKRRGIGRQLEALQAEIERIDRDSSVLRSRLEERTRRTDPLRRARQALAELRRSAEDASSQLDAAQEELARKLSALASLDAQLEEAGRRVRAAESGRRERSDLMAEASDLEDKAAWVGTVFRTAVLEMEQKLLAHAQAMFEREFARYFASLVDDPALVARTDPAFTPLVMIEGEWTPAEALSGGERTSLALAFRLALAHVVRSMGSLHLDTILLDEPTDGFSPEQVLRMGELLEELALPQVVLVSHEGGLAAIADRVVRVQKWEGRSVLETPGAVGPSEAAKGTETVSPGSA